MVLQKMFSFSGFGIVDAKNCLAQHQWAPPPWSALVGSAPLLGWSARSKEALKGQGDTSVVSAKDPPMPKSAR